MLVKLDHENPRVFIPVVGLPDEGWGNADDERLPDQWGDEPNEMGSLVLSKESWQINCHCLVGWTSTVGCFQKIGVNTPKMDGENNGKPYEQMDDFGGKHHYFRKHPYIIWEKLFFFFVRDELEWVLKI